MKMKHKTSSLDGTQLTKTFAWRSTNTAIATINSSGSATGIAAGSANIIASADNIDSPPASLQVQDAEPDLGGSRTGTFVRQPGSSYTVSGTAFLEEQSDGSLVLRFSQDFTTSVGPGLEVFLSTTSSRNASNRGLGGIKSHSGAQSYSVGTGVGLDDYNYVLIHCEPANVTFGYAQLN